MGLGTCRLNANVVNDDAAGTLEFAGGDRAPQTGGVVDDQVGPDAAQVGEHGGQHAYGGAREPLQQRDRRRRIGQRLVAAGVEAHGRAGGLDLLAERGRGVVADGVATPDELGHDRQRRVDVSVHGDVEERDRLRARSRYGIRSSTFAGPSATGHGSTPLIVVDMGQPRIR